MSKYALGAFLLLYGVSVVFHPDIPNWVLGVTALVAGCVCVISAVKGGK